MKIYLVLLTYTPTLRSPRASYAEKTLRSTLDNLKTPGKISVHIADDGSPEKHVKKLTDIAGGYANVEGVTFSNSERRGYGANYNLSTQTTHRYADVVMPIEDDWQLTETLDVEPFLRTLEETEIQCIRLGYLGFTDTLRGALVNHADRQYLQFDPTSPERHVCAGHPRIETVDWERNVGPWPEGHDPGTTEFLWCDIPAARKGVAWDMQAPRGGWFHHIGTVQAREDQKA